MTLSRYIKTSFTTSKGAANLFVALVWASSLLTYLKAIVLRLPFGDAISVLLIPVIYLCLFSISFGYIIRFYRLDDFLFALLLFLIYGLQYLVFPENEQYVTYYFPFLFLNLIPIYFIGIATDIQDVFQPLYVFSILCVIFQAVNTIFIDTSTRLLQDYKENMYEAYKLLPYVIFCFWGWLRKFDIWGLLASFLGLFLLISFASRGPILCTLLFISVYVLLFKAFRGKWFVIFSLFLLVFLVVNYYDIIELAIQSVFSRFGFNLRIINMIGDEEALFDSSGRDSISARLLNYLSDAPFIGYGIGGSETLVGTYAHNFFIDFFITFGIIPGAIFLVFYFGILIKGFWACRNELEKGFFLVLFFCFVKLFFSYTFLRDSSWIYLLGYCIGLIRRNKYKIRNEPTIACE